MYAALTLSGRFSAVWKIRNKRGNFKDIINNLINCLEGRKKLKSDGNMIIRGLGQKSGVVCRKFPVPRTRKLLHKIKGKSRTSENCRAASHTKSCGIRISTYPHTYLSIEKLDRFILSVNLLPVNLPLNTRFNGSKRPDLTGILDKKTLKSIMIAASQPQTTREVSAA